jgi:hypothetical protein
MLAADVNLAERLAVSVFQNERATDTDMLKSM